jgi:hypothetical protein
MTRIEMGTSIGATGFNPVDVTYNRNTADGAMPVISYLVGSHFNERLDGIVTASDDGLIENDTITVSGGKLIITGDSDVTESLSTKSATHSTFMYMWPKTRIHGNSEIAVAQVGEITPAVAYTSRMRTKFHDLSNNDKLIVDLDPGNSVANTDPVLSLKEEHNGVETTLATFNLPTGEIYIDWQIKFLDEGVTKFYYKTNTGLPTLLWRGDLTADLAECKVMHEFLTNEATPTRSVKIDFLWIFYKSIFTGYDIIPANRYLGNIKILDQNLTETEANWIQVYAKDHQFIGDRVVDNGLIRLRFKSTPEIEISGWNGSSAWVLLGSILPENSGGSLASNLLDVIFSSYNDSACVITAKFGILDYRITLRKGMPYARFTLNSSQFTFNTTKERFALSANTEATNLKDYNQLSSDDANRGNPKNLAVPETISTFIESADVDRGLNHIDDNWFAVYNLTTTDTIGWLAPMLIPNELEVEATDATTLSQIRMGFRRNVTVAVGALNSLPTQLFSGVPRPFFPGNDDDYVKWHANSSVFDMSQSPFVRRRR